MRPGRRPSPTVCRFIALRVLEPFLLALAAFAAVHLLADVSDRIEELMRCAFTGLGLKYFALRLPLIISELLPVALLAGVMLGFAMLNRTGELLAFQGLGVSRLGLMMPVLAIAVLLGLFDFVFSETVVPAATRKARYVLNVEMRHEAQTEYGGRAIWIRGREGFLSVERYDPRRMELRGVTLFDVGRDYRLRAILEAESAVWDGRGWKPSGVHALRLLPHGAVDPAAVGAGFRLDATPADFGVILPENPDEFSLAELDRYIEGLRRKGMDPGGYLVKRALKYALPFSCVVMAVLGAALGLDARPRSLGVARTIGLGILAGFGYWLTLGVTASLGLSQLIAPWLAAWLPNLLFAILAISIFLYGEET